MALRHRVSWDPDFMRRDARLWPLAEAASLLGPSQQWPLHAELDAMFLRRTAANGAPPLCFRTPEPRARERHESPGAIDPDRLYDGCITRHRIVPTRAENWHDLLNALCFATWPKSKLALHERQYAVLSQRLLANDQRLPPSRTSEQDALTIFDEGGVVIAASSEAARALGKTEALSSAFETTLREICASGHAKLVPFGHALFEHMVEGLPCPGTSARILVLPSIAEDSLALLRLIDEALAYRLADRRCFQAPREAAHLRLQAFESGVASSSGRGSHQPVRF
jgi:hypothetical protein